MNTAIYLNHDLGFFDDAYVELHYDAEAKEYTVVLHRLDEQGKETTTRPISLKDLMEPFAHEISRRLRAAL
jgi:hypothetical protein